MPSPSPFRRPGRAWIGAAALACAFLLSACGRENAGSGAKADESATLVSQAREVLGGEVRDAVRVDSTIAALMLEPGSAEHARWVVLLAGGAGRWRVRSRLHTYVPVQNVPGRFGQADVDGDGRAEVFAIGTAWSIGGVAAEALVATPDGEAFRYELTQGWGHNAGSVVWTPNLERRPALLAWMASAVHGVLPSVWRESDSLSASTPFVRDATPLTPRAALEVARQRLGWGVKEAIPFPITGGRMGHNVAVLYAQRDKDSADRIAILSGADHVYDVLWTYQGVLSGRILDHAGRFGLTDVDGDGTPEVWEVNGASGSGAWGMGAALIDTGNGERYEAFAGGSWEEPARRETLEVEFTGDFRAKPRARAFLDSVLTAAVLQAHGPEAGDTPGERRARAAEAAWAPLSGTQPAPPRPVPGPVPAADRASCTVEDDGGMDWVSRFTGALWAHDRARNVSWVVYRQAPTSMVAGKRYLWTNVVAGDTAGTRLALFAWDKRAGRMVRVPVPELARVVTPTEFFTLQQQLYRLPACAGECGTALPLHVADGTLVLDETYLTLPPEIDAARELADAKTCVSRP